MTSAYWEAMPNPSKSSLSSNIQNAHFGSCILPTTHETLLSTALSNCCRDNNQKNVRWQLLHCYHQDFLVSNRSKHIIQWTICNVPYLHFDFGKQVEFHCGKPECQSNVAPLFHIQQFCTDSLMLT